MAPQSVPSPLFLDQDDPNSLSLSTVAYYYADEINTLVDMYTDPDFQPFTSQMASGYFVSNRKDKSRKAKEVPAAVDASPLSRYDQLVESLQQSVNALTPTSPSQPQYTINSSHSRSPPRQYPSSPTTQTATNSQQRRHELARLNTSFDDRDNNYNQSTAGLVHAASRHTMHARKSYPKVFAQDYHHLPPPQTTYPQRGGGDVGNVVGSGGNNKNDNMMMDIDDDEEEARYHGGHRGRYNNRVGASSPSTESSNSPGLSPTSSGSSPIDVEMESDVLVLDHQHQHTANHHNHHHPYSRVSVDHPRGVVVAPMPIRPSSVPRLNHHRHSHSIHRSPATPHSTSVPSPRPNFASSSPAIVAVHQNVQFERGGVDMDTIGMEDGSGDGVSPSGPTRNALDETVIQTFNSRLHGFF